jgi:predicted branched-subunit amino acid permease
VPAGIAFGVAARAAGLGAGAAQLMSLLVFSAAGQMGAVSLLGAETSPGVLIATVVVLNAQLLLLSVTVGRQLRLSGLQRPLVAWLLTDGAYGVAAGDGPLSVPSLLGAGASMYAAWNLGTATGSLLGDTLGDPQRFGIDLVVPLTFLSVLVPLLRTGATRIVALTSGLVALLLTRSAPLGVAVLGAATAGAAVGTWWTRSEPDGPPAAAAQRDVLR